jgi:osmotically inducible protein OsmC
MKTTSASAAWQGNLAKGSGKIKLKTTGYETPYNFVSRFESGSDSNPEEFIAAAHAACYSMFLSHLLSEKGHVPREVNTEAHVMMDRNDKGFFISEILLDTTAYVTDINEKTFIELTENSKANCPVSKALSAVKISLKARLVK